MSLSSDSAVLPMLVQPATNGNTNGCNGWGGDWMGWIVLFLIFGMFGWGGMGGLMQVLDEHMNAIKLAYPKEYELVMRKISSL